MKSLDSPATLELPRNQEFSQRRSEIPDPSRRGITMPQLRFLVGFIDKAPPPWFFWAFQQCRPQAGLLGGYFGRQGSFSPCPSTTLGEKTTTQRRCSPDRCCARMHLFTGRSPAGLTALRIRARIHVQVMWIRRMRRGSPRVGFNSDSYESPATKARIRVPSSTSTIPCTPFVDKFFG